MDAETRARIFEPFFTTKEKGQGHRPRALDRVRHRAAERRLHLGAERARPRHHLQGLPARDAKSAELVAGQRAVADAPHRSARHRDDPARRGRRAGARDGRRPPAPPGLPRARREPPVRGADALARARRRRSTCSSPTWSCPRWAAACSPNSSRATARSCACCSCRATPTTRSCATACCVRPRVHAEADHARSACAPRAPDARPPHALRSHAHRTSMNVTRFLPLLILASACSTSRRSRIPPAAAAPSAPAPPAPPATPAAPAPAAPAAPRRRSERSLRADHRRRLQGREPRRRIARSPARSGRRAARARTPAQAQARRRLRRVAKTASDAKSSAPARAASSAPSRRPTGPRSTPASATPSSSSQVGETANEPVAADYGYTIVRRCPVEKARSRHILVRYKGAKNAEPDVKRSKAEAEARASELLAKLAAGADFAALARSRVRRLLQGARRRHRPSPPRRARCPPTKTPCSPSRPMPAAESSSASSASTSSNASRMPRETRRPRAHLDSIGRPASVRALFRSSSVVERSAVNRLVVGSSPSSGAIWSSFKPGDPLLNRSPGHREVIGASPFWRRVAGMRDARDLDGAISAREVESGRARRRVPDRSLRARFGRRLGRESPGPV